MSTFLSLDPRERRAMLAAFVLLPCLGLALRLADLGRLQAWLDRRPVARHPPLSREEAMVLGAAVNRAASRLPRLATCLTRSLALRWMLRRRGTPSDLRIGVRLESGAFEAHAWVERDGVPLNDSPEAVAHYATFDRPIAWQDFR